MSKTKFLRNLLLVMNMTNINIEQRGLWWIVSAQHIDKPKEIHINIETQEGFWHVVEQILEEAREYEGLHPFCFIKAEE